MGEYTIIIDIRPVDFDDEDAVDREIKAFRKKYASAAKEHALVVSPIGQVYELAGSSINVNIELVGKDALRNSRVIHNHTPKDKDSFSRDDFIKYFEYELNQLEIVSGELSNVMRYKGEPITPNRAYELYNNAQHTNWQIAKDFRMSVEMEQLEIMRQLSKTMKGLVFSE